VSKAKVIADAEVRASKARGAYIKTTRGTGAGDASKLAKALEDEGHLLVLKAVRCSELVQNAILTVEKTADPASPNKAVFDIAAQGTVSRAATAVSLARAASTAAEAAAEAAKATKATTAVTMATGAAANNKAAAKAAAKAKASVQEVNLRQLKDLKKKIPKKGPQGTALGRQQHHH
jgi:hypothetical protein